jgi:hypothetical protein
MKTIRVFVFCSVLLLTGCGVGASALPILEAEGYREIILTGYTGGCGRDPSAEGFTAKRGGRTVHGIVCCSYGGACLIRVLR